jgi:hypothetical protein
MLWDKVGVKINSQVALCELVQYNLLVKDASALCERTALLPSPRLRSRAYLSREESVLMTLT